MVNSTKLGAVLDRRIVKVFYRHDDVANVAPSQLNFTLNHHYTSKAGNDGFLTLEQVSVPVDFIRAGKDNSYFTYESDVEFINPKYYTNLSVSVSENYIGTGPVSYTCDVLICDDDLIVPLPVNPVRPPEFEENESPAPLPENSTNVIDPEPAINPYLYALKSSGVAITQYSSKIIYDGRQNLFYKTVKNEIKNFDNLLIENSVVNFTKNSSFFETYGKGSNVVPKFWDIDGPGLILSSSVFDSDLGDVNVWQIHVTNPNSFSALDSITLKTSMDLPAGTSQLTFSFRYQQFIGDTSAGEGAPFENFTLNNTFLALDGSVISQSSFNSSVKFTSDAAWESVYFSFACPTGAVKLNVSLESNSLATTDLSTFRVLLPQLENCYVATTPCLISRDYDQVTTPKQVKIAVPVGFIFETFHSINPEIRGIFELNEAGAGGLRAYLSNGRLNLRQLDVYGAILFTAQSGNINKNAGDLASYCIFIDGNLVSFYVDGNLISTAPAAMSFSYESYVSLGSLFSINTSINSSLKNFVITTVKPG
jgi:hypothetical protein